MELNLHQGLEVMISISLPAGQIQFFVFWKKKNTIILLKQIQLLTSPLIHLKLQVSPVL